MSTIAGLCGGTTTATSKEMNANLIVDKHPFSTGTLLLMMVGGMLIVYGVVYLILKNRK